MKNRQKIVSPMLASFAAVLSCVLLATVGFYLFAAELSPGGKHLLGVINVLRSLSSRDAGWALGEIELLRHDYIVVGLGTARFLGALTSFACLACLSLLWQCLRAVPVNTRTATIVEPSFASTAFGELLPERRVEENQVFSRAISDLKCATEALTNIVGKGSLAEIEGDLDRYELYYNRIIQIAASSNLICNEIHSVHKAILKTSKRLQRLAHQCRDSANFAATTQLDWKRNTMINNLRQVKESHDQVQDIANNIASIHQSTMRLLGETLKVDEIFSERAGKVSSYLCRVQEDAKNGAREFSTMVTTIGESKSNVVQASGFVSSLTQRAEAIVSIIHLIDDLSEQINLQALNASIEAAKLTGGGQRFTEIAEKLCKLTSRSSVASRSVSELLASIQEETNKAQSQLNVAVESIELAFSAVNDCGNTYRQAVSAAKYGLSELSLLESEFSIHLNKLKEIERLGLSTTNFFASLSSLLIADDNMSNRISNETNKLTAHSDKLTQLLAKQYHELNHCEKMLLDSMSLVNELENQATENKHATLSLKVALEELDTRDPSMPLDGASKQIASRHLTLLKNSTETLEHLQLPHTVNN